MTQDIPDFFYSYERYDLVYSITLSVGPISVATISYQDWNGTQEVYKQEFNEHPAKIEDIGTIVDTYSRLGFQEFTLTIISNTTSSFTKKFKVGWILIS